MHKTTLIGALLVFGPLLHGCAGSMLTEPPRQSERVLVCSGSGAYISCHRMTPDQYDKTLRALQQPLTGSRIGRR
jgi:hypothetical protein